MNWGNKITIVFISFVVLIITLVTISMKQDIHMVAENYYEEEIAYGGKMEEIRNGRDWEGDISAKQESSILELRFEDSKKVEGKVKFFRPSDSSLDFSIPIQDEMNIPIEKLKAGSWKILFEWEANGKKHYKEEKIYIQR